MLTSQVLAYEPNTQLRLPYALFPSNHHFNSHRALVLPALPERGKVQLVTVSTSYPTEQLVDFLWQLKNFSQDRLLPLIFVIDWSQPVTQIPGTTWGNKIGVLHSLSGPEEVAATLGRCLKNG